MTMLHKNVMGAEQNSSVTDASFLLKIVERLDGWTAWHN